MELRDKVVAVTGGASGIGAALCRKAAAQGARAVIVADINLQGAQAVAGEIGGLALPLNARNEADFQNLAATCEQRFGTLDLFCANAGIFVLDQGHIASTSNEDWQKIWEINVLAHVWAVRAVLPGMLKRGGGYFLFTASAAGLLSQIGSAPYSVTKHAAVGFAESVAIAHGEQGIGVSVLCPQAVRTAMVEQLGGPGVAGLDGMMEPDQVAEAALAGLSEERFLILPHPEVAEYFNRKASDYDRWLHGMRRLRRQMMPKSSQE